MTPDPAPVAGWRQRIRPALRWASLLLGLGFLVWLVSQSVRDDALRVRDIEWPAAIVALLVTCIADISIAILMVSRFRRHGSTAPVLLLLRAFYLGQIAKYVPGKVAALWFQIETIRQRGAAHIALASNVEVTLLSMLANAAVGVALLLFPWYPWLSVTVIVAGLALSYAFATAQWIAVLGARLARLIGMHVPPAQLDVPGAGRAVLLFYAVTVLVMTPAMIWFLTATLRIDATQATFFAGMALIAWVLSVAAVIVPAGLGVREAIFVALAHAGSADIGVAELGAAAIVLRLFQVAQDLVCAAAFISWARYRRARGGDDAS